MKDFSYDGDPNGVILGDQGDRCGHLSAGLTYVKTGGLSKEGWVINATSVTSAGTGIWYSYFVAQAMAVGGPTVLTLSPAQTGANGNVGLFTNVGFEGVLFNSAVIIQATAWALCGIPGLAAERKWLGIQLDKQGSLFIRAHTQFVEAANVTYGGVLSAGDILRAVIQNETVAADSIIQGFIAVIATPIIL